MKIIPNIEHGPVMNRGMQGLTRTNKSNKVTMNPNLFFA